MSPITIGMPVFNGQEFMQRAIDSLICQTFLDWNLVIADNCSTDNTASLAEHYCRQDKRISLVRRRKNIGAFANFVEIARFAKTPYFMWAAADDEWSPNYISSCFRILKENNNYGFASGNVINIDTAGRIVREYEGFEKFSEPDLENRIRTFLWARESDGKANAIYSIYRTPLIQEICSTPDIFKGWGGDMAIVLAALVRQNYGYSSDAHILKRLTNSNDIQAASAMQRGDYQDIEFGGHFPPREYNSYLNSLCAGATTPRTRALIRRTMLLRRTMLFFYRGLGL